MDLPVAPSVGPRPGMGTPRDRTRSARIPDQGPGMEESGDRNREAAAWSTESVRDEPDDGSDLEPRSLQCGGSGGGWSSDSHSCAYLSRRVAEAVAPARESDSGVVA